MNPVRSLQPPADHGQRTVAAVVPCFRVRAQLAQVLRSIPDLVEHVIVVDDACPERSGEVAESLGDSRVVVLRHDRNKGVGGAVKTGYRHALERGAEVIVKIDGDGQMDPGRIAALIEPIMEDRAALSKGNRFWYLDELSTMPVIRRLGNAGLSFLTKAASGHWAISDPTNGFIAIRGDVLGDLDFASLSDGYFFETSLLVELGKRGFRVEEVPMPARYRDEQSSLSVLRALFGFPPRLALRGAGRIFFRHFWFDFTPSALLLALGLPMVIWGLGFGIYAWSRSIMSGIQASAGTVMLAGLPFILGMNFLLHAASYEMLSDFNKRVSGTPRRSK